MRRVTEGFVEDREPAARKSREAEPRDEELDEVLEDLGGLDGDEDAEAERAPRRRRK